MIAQLLRWRIQLTVAVAVFGAFAGVVVGIYGVEKVVAKGVEFVAHELSPSSFVGRQRYLAIIAVLLIGEILLVGYRNSTVYRFLHPSKSTRIDLYAFLVRMTGLGAILMALVSFGATEWFPMLLRRVAHVEPLDLFANAWLAVGVYHLVYSFGEYWLHRWAHSCEWLWEVHNFHHSAAEMNMITTGRLHPFERAIDDVVLALPLMLFGVNAFVPALVFTIARTVHNLLIHSELKWKWGWFGEYVICSPYYHRVHHSIRPEHYNANYAGHFVFWDWMFGTRYTGSLEADRVGLLDDPYASRGYVHGLVRSTVRSYAGLGKSICRVVRREPPARTTVGNRDGGSATTQFGRQKAA
jgi:sterol desaturase/sphingolipid hydroxylase (fatty acid hydroxylase superfamily)